VIQAEDEVEDQNTTIVEDRDDNIELPETEKWKRKRNTGIKTNKSNQNFEEQFLTVFQTSIQEDEDRSFLESLLPTLRQFNGDQKLLFRSKVIQNLVEIKKMSQVVPIVEFRQETTNQLAPLAQKHPIYPQNDYSPSQDTNYPSTSYLTNDNNFLTQNWYSDHNSSA